MLHCLFDTETSNLIHNSLQPLHKQPHTIEIFCLLLDDSDWSEVDKFHSYVDPGINIPPEVTKITGITQSQLVGKPKFEALADPLAKFLARADVIVAHNLSYDLAVVNFEFERLNRTVAWPASKVCTVEATEHLKGFRLNLTSLHEHLFGEGFAKAHSAENDVRAMARCYIELHKRGEL